MQVKVKVNLLTSEDKWDLRCFHSFFYLPFHRPYRSFIMITDRSVFNDASSSHFHCTPTDFAWHLFSPDTAKCLPGSDHPSVSRQYCLSFGDCRYYIGINGSGSDPTRRCLPPVAIWSPCCQLQDPFISLPQ
jgi:hypothetical protein